MKGECAGASWTQRRARATHWSLSFVLRCGSCSYVYVVLWFLLLFYVIIFAMATPSTEWSNAEVLEFIEIYQGEPALWDSINKLHQNRNALADAWERIRACFSLSGVTIAELKRKKESLMTTYRYHLNKKKRSIKSGAGLNEVYETNWFAFQAMDCFM